jgi:hypothetical protein
VPKLSDKLIGTSVGGEIEDVTYNFTLLELLELFLPIIPANNLQGVLDYGNTATQDINLFGTITTTNLDVTDTANLFITYLNEETHLVGSLFDSGDSVGTAGQVLTSTGDGVEWFTLPPIFTPNLEQVLTEGNTSDIGIILDANIEAIGVIADTANIATELSIQGTVVDYNESAGTAGQVLESTATGVQWVNLPVYSATSPLLFNPATGVFSIQVANSTQGGYLTANDWVTFSGKQDAGNYITALTGEATASGPGSAAVTLNNSSVINKVLTGLNVTGGNVLATDSILTAFGKVQNQINGLVGGVKYQGTWDAATNTPTLTSSVGTQGYYYIVSVDGNTNLNGITDWKVGDWAIFSGGVWQKVDNTDSVTSVNGFTGAVSLTTDNIPEGTTNLYYLDSRARAALSFVAGSGAYNNTTGVITIPTNNNQILNGANYIVLGSLSANSPLSYNNTTGAFSIQVANSTQNGYLSSTDWSTFNSKQGTITLTTTGSSGPSTLVGNTLNIPDYGGALTGYVPYTGATGPVNLGAFDLTVQTLTIGKGNNSLANNTALGYHALFHITTGNYNTAVGYESSHNITTGQYNTTLGQSALFTNTTGSQNTAIGLNALLYNLTGGSNVVVGLDAMQHNTSGSSNTALGYNAGSHITGGSTPNTTASNSIYIGRDTKALADGGTNEIVIGNAVTGNGSNTVTIGNSSVVNNYFTGSIHGGSFIRLGGTASQFLKANGSIDSSAYIVLGSLSASAPLSYNNTTGAFSISQSGTSTDGYLSSTDWNTFNSKQGTITLTTTGSSGPSTLVGNTLNIPDYGGALTGYVPYTGATANVNLGIRALLAQNIVVGQTSTQGYIHFKTGGSTALSADTSQAPYGTNGMIYSFDQTGGNYKQFVLDSSLLTNNTIRTYSMPDASGTLALTSQLTGGTVTSVAALTLGTSGTDLSSSVANSTTTPVITLNVPTASAANRGALSAADWSTFNTKVGGVTATSPLFSSGGSTPNITIQQSSGSQDGYLSSTDWTTFNNKQASGNYITSLTGEATGTGPGATAVTLNNASVTAKVLTGINITGGTVQATDTMLTAFGKLQNQINGLIGSTIYQGTWNASTNTPALASGVGVRGYYYIVSVAGNTNLDGITDWFVGDWAIFDGTAWQQVDNTDAVVSVNGFTGAVSLTTDNIPEGSTNLYYLDSRARAALSFTAGSGAYNSTTGVITIPTNTSQLTNGANFITLASLSGTAPIQYNSSTGAISITQSGTASNGYLSSTDWTTFNDKQGALTLTTTGTSGASTLVGNTLNIPQYQSVLTNPVTGTGTTNYIPKWTSSSAIGNSQIFDNGTQISINTGSPSSFGTQKFLVVGNGAASQVARFTDAANADLVFDFPSASVSRITPQYGTGGILQFANGTGFNPTMQISGNGSLLIGTTIDAGYKLDVSGTARVTSLIIGGGGIKISGGTPYVGGYTRDGLWGATATPNFISTTGNAGPYGGALFLLGYDDNESGLYSPAYGFPVKSTDGNNTPNCVVRALVMRDTDKNTYPFIVYNNGTIDTTGSVNIINSAAVLSLNIENTTNNAILRLKSTTNPFWDFQANTNGTFQIDRNDSPVLTLGTSGTATFSNLAGTGTRMVVADASGVLSTQAIGSGSITGSGTTNYVPKFTSGSAIGDSALNSNGQGVGLYELAYQGVDVNSSAQIMLMLTNTRYNSTNASGENKLTFGWANHFAAGVSAYKSTVNTTGFKFYTEYGFNTPYLRMILSPEGQLSVNLSTGAAAFGNGINIITAPGTYSTGHGGILQFQNEDVITAGIRGVRDPGSWASSLLFYTHTSGVGNTFGTTFTEKARITDDGNLLVNTTTNAGYKLDVNGIGRFAGRLYADSNITFSGYIQPSSNVGYGVKSANGTVLQEWYDGATYNYGSFINSGSITTNANFINSQPVYSTTGNVGNLLFTNTYPSTYNVAQIASVLDGYFYAAKLVFRTADQFNANLLVDRLTIASGGAATFSSSVTATNLYLGSLTNEQLMISGTGSRGIGISTITSGDPFLRLYDNTTIKADIWWGRSGNYMGINSVGTNTAINPYGGNVLIGTTTDSGYKFNVNGTGRFASMIYGFGGVRIAGGNGNTGYTPDGLWASTATPNFIDTTGYAGPYGNALNGSGLLLGYADNGSGLYSPAYGFQVKSTDGAGVPNRVVVAIRMKDTDKNTYPLTIYNNGEISTSGQITATAFFESSDSRLKTLIKDDYKPLGINSVKARLYIKDGKEEVGYYAQDLEAILPSAVSKNDAGFLSLSYTQVHTAKIAIIEDEVDLLKKEVAELKVKLQKYEA